MADTNLKKNQQGYGYKYTDLAEIHEYLEEKGWSYRQNIEIVDGVDYIVTTPIKDGKEEAPIRGCRVVQATLSGKSNPAQEQGSALTYARRYSLLMAFGLATTDDDAACMDRAKAPAKAPKPTREELMENLMNLAEMKGIPEEGICEKCKVKTLEELSDDRLQKGIDWLRGK